MKMFKRKQLKLKLTLYILVYMICNTMCCHTYDMTFIKNVTNSSMFDVHVTLHHDKFV